MKKLVLSLILAAALLALTSCGKNGASSKAASSGEVSSASASSRAAVSDETSAAEQSSPASEAAQSVTTAESTPAKSAPAEMHVGCAGISGGVIADKYGKFGTQLEKNIPTLSVPLTISNPPAGVAGFAILMENISVSTNPVNWLAANITNTSIPENASVTMKGTMLQGKNDSGTIGYAGPAPTKKTHTYSIKIYALSQALNLTEGFTRDEFLKEIEGKILVQKEITGTYRYK